MKLFGFLLMTIATILGTVSATTAYLPVLDAGLVGLTLNEPAGVRMTDEGEVPIAVKDQELSESTITELQDAGVERVRVKEFAFSRWSHWPLFALAVVLMIAGTMMVRVATKGEIRASSEAGHEGSSRPEQLVDEIDREVADLRRALEDILDEEARLVTIVDRVGRLQSQQIAQFFDTRSSLVGRLGLAGYAGAMDRFSALERSLNRAWSAAADEYEEEAMACLERASSLVPEVRERLRG